MSIEIVRNSSQSQRLMLKRTVGRYAASGFAVSNQRLARRSLYSASEAAGLVALRSPSAGPSAGLSAALSSPRGLWRRATATTPTPDPPARRPGAAPPIPQHASNACCIQSIAGAVPYGSPTTRTSKRTGSEARSARCCSSWLAARVMRRCLRRSTLAAAPP